MESLVPTEKILNLGAGVDPLNAQGVTTVDINASTHPDVVHDLNIRPWPFCDNSFDRIVCRDFIEHVDHILPVMEEIYRVGKKGARIQITTPHFSCANSFTDPTHRYHLGMFSFDYFTGKNQWGFYSKVRLQKRHRVLYFYPGLLRRPLSWLANHYPEIYEKNSCGFFQPGSLILNLALLNKLPVKAAFLS